MNDQIKEELIAQFRDYLESDFDPDPSSDPIDQMTLFSELSGLKNEVRIESRQLKGALDDFRQVFTTMDQANREMSGMVEHLRQQQSEFAQAALKPVLLSLIDLYDRIASGISQTPPAPSLLQRLVPDNRTRNWIQGHLQGQEMILNRLLELLRQCGVTPAQTVSLAFDPTFMKAVGFETDTLSTNGTVLHEIRKGFFMDGKLLRPAEVIVNKITTG